MCCDDWKQSWKCSSTEWDNGWNYWTIKWGYSSIRDDETVNKLIAKELKLKFIIQNDSTLTI